MPAMNTLICMLYAFMHKMKAYPIPAMNMLTCNSRMLVTRDGADGSESTFVDSFSSSTATYNQLIDQVLRNDYILRNGNRRGWYGTIYEERNKRRVCVTPP